MECLQKFLETLKTLSRLTVESLRLTSEGLTVGQNNSLTLLSIKSSIRFNLKLLIDVSYYARVRCSRVFFQITAVLSLSEVGIVTISSQTKAVYRRILMTMENRSALRKHMLCDRQSVPLIDIKQTNTGDKTQNWRKLIGSNSAASSF